MCLRVWFSQTPGSLSFEGISFQNTRDFLGVSFHNTWKSWVLFIQLQNKDARRPEPVAGTTDVPNSIFELTFAVFRFPVSFWSVLGWFCYPVLTLIITSFDLSLTYWVWTPVQKRYNVMCVPHGCHQKAGAGNFPRLLRTLPRLLSWGNWRKIEPKEIRSRLIPRLLVVFTRQLEILVTVLVPYNFEN